MLTDYITQNEVEYYVNKVGNDLLFRDFERVIKQYRRGFLSESDVKNFLRNALFNRRYIGDSASITARYEHYGMVCKLAESFS